MSIVQRPSQYGNETASRSLSPPRSLILVHPDGYIEHFADRRLESRIVLVPSAQSIAGEIAADELVMRGLPDSLAAIYSMDCLQATANFRQVSPLDIALTCCDMTLVQALNNVGGRKWR